MSPLSRLFRHFRSDKPADSSERGPAIGWLVVGLGNPGEQYQRSRHNLGFMVVDRLAGRHQGELSRRRFKALSVTTEIRGRSALLAKPETFYNLSGESVSSMLGYYKIPVERLIVLHDDLDLETGRIRIKRGGGDAGNRGVRSIAESMSPDFIRIRIGIGGPPGENESKDFVLRPMGRAELANFDPVIDRAADAVETLLAEDLERAMGRFNQRPA